MPKRPHKLDLYRLSVQNPLAEVALLHRMYSKPNAGREARILKEDFAGTSIISMAWVAIEPEATAHAVDTHGPTSRWAQRLAKREIGRRADAIQFHVADVREITKPKVDVIAALNFSAFVFHDPTALTGYFKKARQSLRPGGIYIMDVFGGPGAMKTITQSVEIEPPDHEPIGPFEYHWEQRSYDAVTAKIDCRIHYTLSDGQTIQNAFRYDWRLWTLPELSDCLKSAGFSKVQIWCDRYDAKEQQSDGVYQPVKHIPAREDWIAYVVAQR